MFHTWYANYHLLDFLQNHIDEFNDKENSQKDLKQIVHNAIKHVSKKLNNTPSISKKAYVDNKLFQVIIGNPRNFVNKIPESNINQYLLGLIKKYYM